MKALTKEEVVQRAEQWVQFHAQREFTQMDECLARLSPEDTRRVYLCGQRMSAGLKLKVLPSTIGEEENEKRTTRSAEQSAQADKGKVPVGSNRRTKGSSKKKGNSK